MPSIALPATAADRRSLSTNAAAPAAPQLQPRITSLTDVTRAGIDTFWQPLIIGQNEDLVVGRMLDWALFRRAERWRWMAFELGELRRGLGGSIRLSIGDGGDDDLEAAR
jgi:hypothetical protein